VALKDQVLEYGRLYTNAQTQLKALSAKNAPYAELKAKLASAEATRQLLVNRLRDTKLFVDSAMGYYRVYGQASAKDIDWKKRAMKIAAVSAVGAGMGLLVGMLLACFVEVSDTRLKTISDIERVTNLPVLATLGDLEKMSAEEQIGWAFRTLTILRGKLCKHPDDALVCGIISSRHGEGRSTWVNQLVSAASQRGLRVLTVDTRPTADGPRTEPRPPQHATRPANNGNSNGKSEESARKGPIVTPPPTNPPTPVSKEDQEANDLLSKPMAVAERLKDPESIVHIPIPGWVWSLQRRQQWQEALQQWREIDNTVILIELPPASCPEAILLAEKIPQLIWLVGSGMADVQETREQLETLRHAHCNIVGAVLNQAPPPAVNTRFTRWFSRFSAMILLGLGLGVCAGVAAEAPGDAKPREDVRPAGVAAQAPTLAAEDQPKEQKLAFSGTKEIRRAKWQEKLTLGAGDAMDISLYGHPDLTRTNIFVGPDGRISYLQVQGLKVEGMTIEELRARLDEELAKYFNVARTIVIPTAFTSKKYYVLGKVNSKGVYSLDRPMTIVEAVARAQGLETGLYERHTVEMADLSRSFLIRNGQRQTVDFEKLFYDGDLKQNIMIEPNDFLFFGAAASKEIYVLGEVMNPGAVGFVPNATIITAITDRGGYTDRAYKRRVLVVRGSLNKPETFVVDTKEILEAAKPDFKLESHDIVYVGHRPWIRAEELLDEATQSFIEGFVTAFSGVKIGPFIKHPIFGD
jgi:protein involved in polysaccharide export with SLBB domain